MTVHIKREQPFFTGALGSSTKATSGTIMIVDDMPQNLELLETLLVAKGFKVVKANNGKETLELVGQVLPDVIFLDVMMPEIDGFEVTRRLRARQDLPYIPIVLITALQDSKSRLTGLEAGADEFLSKPFSQPELIVRAQSLIRLRRYNQALSQSLEENRYLNDLLAAENTRLTLELDHTREAQLRLMPQFGPGYPGVSFAVHYQPALEVGGDYYDYVRLDEHRFVVLLGDAVGKGGAAVLSVAIIKSVLASEFAHLATTERQDFDPARLLTHINQVICGPLQTSRTEMTLFCGLIDLEAGRIRYSNAGQTFPYLAHRDALEELKLSGLPIGLAEEALYSNREISFQEGDRLILYSDGINETMNFENEQFGLERLEMVLQETAYLLPDMMLEQVLKQLYQFSQDPGDDQTLVVFGF
jgi:phosphoserine phosphatase RsbU/P